MKNFILYCRGQLRHVFVALWLSQSGRVSLGVFLSYLCCPCRCVSAWKMTLVMPAHPSLPLSLRKPVSSSQTAILSHSSPLTANPTLLPYSPLLCSLTLCLSSSFWVDPQVFVESWILINDDGCWFSALLIHFTTVYKAYIWKWQGPLVILT